MLGLCAALMLVLAVVQASSRDTAEPGLLSQALAAESRGEAAKAESLLRQAVQADRGSLPRWTLAGFYLRHEDRRAWHLLAEALSIALHGGQDVSGIFETGWQFRPDGSFLLKQMVGTKPDALKAYVIFLLRTNRIEALAEPALMTCDQALLLQASDALLTAGRVAEARKVWQRAVPPPGESELLTNAQLRPPQPLGFDWRFNSLSEAAVSFEQGVRIDFTGRQPSPLELLIQTVLLEPGRYRLTWESKAQTQPGVFWQATGAAIFREPVHSSPGWREESFQFDVHTEGPVRLALSSERLPGASRFQGAFQLRSPSLRSR